MLRLRMSGWGEDAPERWVCAEVSQLLPELSLSECIRRRNPGVAPHRMHKTQRVYSVLGHYLSSRSLIMIMSITAWWNSWP